MSKIALFSDIHLGIDQHSLESVNEISKTLDFIYTESIRRDVKYIAFLGDMFHSRKDLFVPAFNVAISSINKFSEKFEKTFFILGNHDIYYKETSDVHSLKFFDLIKSDKLCLIDKSTPVELESRKILMVPWLGSLLNMPKDHFDLMFGHLNIDVNSIKEFYAKTFNVEKSSLSNEVISAYFSEHQMGLPLGQLDKQDTEISNNSKFKPKDAFNFLKDSGKIYSGHFHNRDSFSRFNKHFTYIGSPMELTWGECHNSHGFYILDLETLEDEFIENKNAVRHIKCDYSFFSNKSEEELKKFFVENYSNYIQIDLNNAEALENRLNFLNLINNYANQSKLILNSTAITPSLGPETQTITAEIKTRFDFILKYLNSITEEEFEYRKITKDGMIKLLGEYYNRINDE